MKGILVTIEGIDGSGKGTQTEMLKKKLEEASIPIKIYSFPCYENTFFGKEVGAFLRGEFGTIEQVHPKLASILFAGDRFEKKKEIEADLANGCIVLCDRYVDSNIAHQCAKLPDSEKTKFSSWLERLEYEIFSLPRPDLTIFLDVPINISKKLVLEKQARSYTDEKEDIHEASHEYLKKVYSSYVELAERRKWNRIECTINENIRPVGEISIDIFHIVMKEKEKFNNG